jgi:glycosyltransferase involved in cell wall biosynthesis
MKILWVNPSFLDYRIPVYSELDRIAEGGLTIVFSKARVPKRVVDKIQATLGSRAIGLEGERHISFGPDTTDLSNSHLHIPYQPGLLKKVLSQPTDVIIAEGFFQWTPCAILRKLLRGTPLIVSYERTSHTERNCPWWRTIYRKAVARLSDAIVCNGILSAEYLQHLGVQRSRIVMGGMAADVEGLTVQVERALRLGVPHIKTVNDRPVFLYVGQLIDRKGIAELLEGWKAYTAIEHEPGSLVLAGGGGLRESLERYVKKESLRSVYFLGEVNYDEIGCLYAAADVFVISTLEDNWSLVVPEAMSCGLPIACSKYNGCWPELVKHEDNGYVFDPHECKSTADAFAYFRNNQAHLATMGERSKEIVSHYTPRSAAEAIYGACLLACNSRRKTQ